MKKLFVMPKAEIYKITCCDIVYTSGLLEPDDQDTSSTGNGNTFGD